MSNIVFIKKSISIIVLLSLLINVGNLSAFQTKLSISKDFSLKQTEAILKAVKYHSRRHSDFRFSKIGFTRNEDGDIQDIKVIFKNRENKRNKRTIKLILLSNGNYKYRDKLDNRVISKNLGRQVFAEEIYELLKYAIADRDRETIDKIVGRVFAYLRSHRRGREVVEQFFLHDISSYIINNFGIERWIEYDNIFFNLVERHEFAGDIRPQIDLESINPERIKEVNLFIINRSFIIQLVLLGNAFKRMEEMYGSERRQDILEMIFRQNLERGQTFVWTEPLKSEFMRLIENPRITLQFMFREFMRPENEFVKLIERYTHSNMEPVKNSFARTLGVCSLGGCNMGEMIEELFPKDRYLRDVLQFMQSNSPTLQVFSAMQTRDIAYSRRIRTVQFDRRKQEEAVRHIGRVFNVILSDCWTPEGLEQTEETYTDGLDTNLAQALGSKVKALNLGSLFFEINRVIMPKFPLSNKAGGLRKGPVAILIIQDIIGCWDDIEGDTIHEKVENYSNTNFRTKYLTLSGRITKRKIMSKPITFIYLLENLDRFFPEGDDTDENSIAPEMRFYGQFGTSRNEILMNVISEVLARERITRHYLMYIEPFLQAKEQLTLLLKLYLQESRDNKKESLFKLILKLMTKLNYVEEDINSLIQDIMSFQDEREVDHDDQYLDEDDYALYAAEVEENESIRLQNRLRINMNRVDFLNVLIEAGFENPVRNSLTGYLLDRNNYEGDSIRNIKMLIENILTGRLNVTLDEDIWAKIVSNLKFVFAESIQINDKDRQELAVNLILQIMMAGKITLLEEEVFAGYTREKIKIITQRLSMRLINLEKTNLGTLVQDYLDFLRGRDREGQRRVYTQVLNRFKNIMDFLFRTKAISTTRAILFSKEILDHIILLIVQKGQSTGISLYNIPLFLNLVETNTRVSTKGDVRTLRSETLRGEVLASFRLAVHRNRTLSMSPKRVKYISILTIIKRELKKQRRLGNLNIEIKASTAEMLEMPYITIDTFVIPEELLKAFLLMEKLFEKQKLELIVRTIVDRARYEMEDRPSSDAQLNQKRMEALDELIENMVDLSQILKRIKKRSSLSKKQYIDLLVEIEQLLDYLEKKSRKSRQDVLNTFPELKEILLEENLSRNLSEPFFVEVTRDQRDTEEGTFTRVLHFIDGVEIRKRCSHGEIEDDVIDVEIIKGKKFNSMEFANQDKLVYQVRRLGTEIVYFIRGNRVIELTGTIGERIANVLKQHLRDSVSIPSNKAMLSSM